MPRLSAPSVYLIFLLMTMSCSTPQKQEEEAAAALKGSWDLIKIKDHNLNKWNTIGDTIMYQKHITPNSFVWLNFDKKNERLIGIGGGTYDFTGDEYTEYIAFFYPTISSLKGQPIPFEVTFKDGQWFHTGYFLNEQTDIETGKVLSVDTVEIEEIWERTKQPINENQDLVGSWEMISYKNKIGEEYIEYPNFIGFIKLLTPTHFTWIKYDRQGDEVYAAGSGTYTFNEGVYQEEIHMIFPENTGQIGESIDFEYRLNDNQWYHYGYVPKLSIDSGGIRKDSILIDEFWEPFTHSNVKELLL